MDRTIKNRIISAAEQYRDDNPDRKGERLSAAELSRRAGVTGTTYSLARKAWESNAEYLNGTSPIADSFFRKIAGVIGFQLAASYWMHVDTVQYIQTINTIEEARDRGEARMILGETGCGKTYAIDRFVAQNPTGVYRVTVNDCDTLRDILAELKRMLRIDTKERGGSLLRRICGRLRELAMSGERPILVFDEVENLKRTGIKAIKAVYDVVRGIVPIVLVGTPEFVYALENLKNRGVKGMAQFVRRFKAGQVALAKIDRRFTAFMPQIKDEELRQLLSRIADNYGELHDYLERAIREADEQGEQLSVGLFKELYNISA